MSLSSADYMNKVSNSNPPDHEQGEGPDQDSLDKSPRSDQNEHNAHSHVDINGTKTKEVRFKDDLLSGSKHSDLHEVQEDSQEEHPETKEQTSHNERADSNLAEQE